jgi:DNA recombination protein RmuC
MTWTQIKQAQNHEEVYKLANEMVERVGQFVKKYEEVGAALDKAQKAYEGGKAKLEDHGQSIVMSANKLIKLGAKNSKNPLPSMTDIDEVEGVELIEN